MPQRRKHHRISQPHTHRPPQRGAMGLLGVLTVLLAFAFAALAIDTGRLWVARQDMQHAADMAALAAARHNGCGTNLDEARERAATSAKQFGVNTDQPGVTLTVTRGNLANALISGANSQVFIPAAEPSDTTTAARVLLKKTVPKSLLMGGFAGQTIELSAVATAQGEAPKATFSVGTRFGITQSQADFISKLFGGILGGSNLNLTPGSLNSLATSVVNLEALRIAAGAASLNELLNRQVTITELLRWISTAGTNIDAAGQQALQSIISASANNGNLAVRVGDVFNLDVPAPDGVATANINVLDLVTAGLQIGGKDQLINLNVSVTNVAFVRIKLLGLPKIAIGPKGQHINGSWCTRATMAQMDVMVGIDTQTPSIAGFQASTDLVLHLVVGGADGHLTDLIADSSGGTASVQTSSSLLSLALKDTPGTGPGYVAVTVPTILLGKKTVKINVLQTFDVVESKGRVMNVNVPAPVRKNLPQRAQRGTDLGDAIASAIKNSKLSLSFDGLGILGSVLEPVLKLVTSTVQAVLNALVAPLVADVIAPLLDVLGIGGTGVSVELTDIVAPQPILKI
jgi:uncharacterized membrane protein